MVPNPLRPAIYLASRFALPSSGSELGNRSGVAEETKKSKLIFSSFSFDLFLFCFEVFLGGPGPDVKPLFRCGERTIVLFCILQSLAWQRSVERRDKNFLPLFSPLIVLLAPLWISDIYYFVPLSTALDLFGSFARVIV